MMSICDGESIFDKDILFEEVTSEKDTEFPQEWSPRLVIGIDYGMS
jgi:hypothetical protein